MPDQLWRILTRRLMPRNLMASLIACLAALGLLMACATSKTAGGQTGRFIVSVPKAAFYKYGPAQSFGPDLQLGQGQRITKLENGYGFSHVMTDDGTTGYISNEDIKPAPPEGTAAGQKPGTPASSGSSSRRGGRSRNNLPTAPMPSLDINDVPLPMPDNSEPPRSTPPKSTPNFRY